MPTISIFQGFYNGKYGEGSVAYNQTDIEYKIENGEYIGTIITSREFYSEKLESKNKEKDDWKTAVYKCTFDKIPAFIKEILVYNIEKLPKILELYKKEYAELSGSIDIPYSIEIDGEIFEYSTIDIKDENHKKAINFIEYFNPFQALSNEDLYKKTNYEPK